MKPMNLKTSIILGLTALALSTQPAGAHVGGCRQGNAGECCHQVQATLEVHCHPTGTSRPTRIMEEGLKKETLERLRQMQEPAGTPRRQ